MFTLIAFLNDPVILLHYRLYRTRPHEDGEVFGAARSLARSLTRSLTRSRVLV